MRFRRFSRWLVAGTLATAVPALALFSNGGFENGTLDGWTKSYFANPGLSGEQPFTGASIVRGSGGQDAVAVLGAGTDPRDPTIKYPRFGDYVTRVNWGTAQSSPPTGQVSNTIKQSTTVTSADIDPVDGLVHIRFTYAPVMNDGGHAPEGQPFFYVGVKNLTSSKTLYEAFAYANQPGVPWKVLPGSVFTTDWQVVDVSPGDANLKVGDTVEIEVTAAGCSAGGHWGYVYVDAFGSSIPGLYVVQQVAQSVNPGGTLHYKLVTTNNGTAAGQGAVVKFEVPAKTHFTSVSDTTRCSYASGTRTVTCNLGTVPVGDAQNVEIAVTVDPGESGTVSSGNYSVAGTGYDAILGPLKTSEITTTPLADLSVAISDGVVEYNAGAQLSYTVVVTNSGPTDVTGATVKGTLPAALTTPTWTCTAQAGASCPASGTGNVDSSSVDIEAGSSVTFTLVGAIPVGFSEELAATATVEVPSGVLDPASGNNTAVDRDREGVPPVLTSVSPASGAIGAAVDLTLKGEDFSTTGLECEIGGEPVSELQLVYFDRLTAKAPTNLPVGRHDVTCRTSFGSSTLEEGYEVAPDSDEDGTIDTEDADDDNDGTLDALDALPLDPTEVLDTDKDGTGNNADTDDDGDGTSDAQDDLPLDKDETVDTDKDGTGNNADTDDDNDGTLDDADAFPLDKDEQVDTDEDGIGNKADLDDDGDSVFDMQDAFPLDKEETVDTDSDLTGNNADFDDDEDGVLDDNDAFPLDHQESVDTDNDGVGNNEDYDDDDDHVLDPLDAFPLDATETIDTDGDHTGNNADTDDDSDGVLDADDAFPLDDAESRHGRRRRRQPRGHGRRR